MSLLETLVSPYALPCARDSNWNAVRPTVILPSSTAIVAGMDPVDRTIRSRDCAVWRLMGRGKPGRKEESAIRNEICKRCLMIIRFVASFPLTMGDDGGFESDDGIPRFEGVSDFLVDVQWDVGCGF